jgi:hypothetical protein
MKELLTKTFWQDVKRTFDEARAETIPTIGDSQAPEVSAPPESTQGSGTITPDADIP